VARRHEEYTAKGATVAAIVIDEVGRNAAMVEKLHLPFPILSDPERTLAIEPYGVADPVDAREIARPTTVVIDPSGAEVWRHASLDFAERPSEDEALEAIAALGLPATSQTPPAPGRAEPGPKAMPFDSLTAYYRGAKFAAIAMGRRFPESKENAAGYSEQMDRYIEAVHQTRDLL